MENRKLSYAERETVRACVRCIDKMATLLNTIWDNVETFDAASDVLDDGYPFERSFDEMVWAISCWRDSVEDKISALKYS